MFLEIIKNIVSRLCRDKAYVVKKDDVLEYEQVRNSLDTIAEKCFKNESNDFLRFEGESVKRIETDLLPRYRFYDKNYPKHNLVLPVAAAMFFLGGGTWKEITDYECIRMSGMLHGERRRLKIV